MNIGEIIRDVENVVKEKHFKARDEIKKILLKNCKFLAQQYDPHTGENKPIYSKGINFIWFKEETTHIKNNHLHKSFKLKVIGQYQKQIYYVNVLGPVIQECVIA